MSFTNEVPSLKAGVRKESFSRSAVSAVEGQEQCVKFVGVRRVCVSAGLDEAAEINECNSGAAEIV